jgi:hypothetical protein
MIDAAQLLARAFALSNGALVGKGYSDRSNPEGVGPGLCTGRPELCPGRETEPMQLQEQEHKNKKAGSCDTAASLAGHAALACVSHCQD